MQLNHHRATECEQGEWRLHIQPSKVFVLPENIKKHGHQLTLNLLKFICIKRETECLCSKAVKRKKISEGKKKLPINLKERMNRE